MFYSKKLFRRIEELLNFHLRDQLKQNLNLLKIIKLKLVWKDKVNGDIWEISRT